MTPIRATFALLIPIALTVSAGQIPSTAQSPAPERSTALSVPNGGFEAGTARWTTTSRSHARLDTTTTERHSGARALKVTATRATKFRVRTRADVRDISAAGTRHRWVARVRTDVPRTVRLTVKERNAGKVVAHKTRKVRVQPGTWRKVQVTTSAKYASPAFRLIVAAPKAAKDEDLLVDSVQVRQLDDASSNGGEKLTNNCTFTTRGLPSCGSYLGMAYGSNTDPSSLEKELGGRLGVRRTYYRADQVAGAVRTAREDLAKGRLPWVSFKFPQGWSEMASGKGDAWAKDLAAQFAALDGPVWLAFHHEPENDGDIQQWRRAQERLAPIIRSGGNNLAFTVVLTGWHQFYGPTEYSLANIWPRNVKVDVAGFDIYNSHGVVKNGKELKATKMDSAYFAKIQQWAGKEGVAWGLAETGYTNKAATEDPNWIARTHKELEKRGGVAFAYFNTSLNSIAPWTLGNSTKLNAYRSAAEGTPRLPLP